MDNEYEKASLRAAESTRSIQRLKADVQENAAMLTLYEKKFRDQDQPPPLRHQNNEHVLHKVTIFIENAPASAIGRLGKKLQKLVRHVITKFQRRGLRTPVLIGDSLDFEDALGRRSTLLLKYFVEWDQLKPFLVHIFKGLPGEYQVQRGNYRLTYGSNSFATVNKANWSYMTKYKGLVKMYIVSTVPVKTHKPPRCPICNHVSPANTSAWDVVVVCPHCDSTFRILRPAPHSFVKPSDGDCRSSTMLAQKKAGELSYPFSIYHRELEEQSYNEVSHQSKNHDNELTLTNFGMSQIKNSIVRTTTDPIMIAASIEDLLDQFLTASEDPQIATDTVVVRLRAVLSLVHDEAQRKDELNYLDFKSEHVEFMKQSRKLTKEFHSRIQALKSGRALPDNTRAWAVSFSDWVKNHYAVTSRRSDLVSMSVDHANDTLVLVKALVGGLRGFRLPASLTVEQLKKIILRREGIPVHKQYLVYKGCKLEDHRTLGHCKIGPSYYVYVLLPIWGPNQKEIKSKWTSAPACEVADEGENCDYRHNPALE